MSIKMRLKKLKMCSGLFMCLICTGSPVSLSAIKTKEHDWPLYIPRSIGTILGALFAGLVLDRLGRRELMIFSGFWVLLTIDCLPWLPPEIFFYLHGFSGFGYGMTFVIYIVYISETVCAKYRGLAISLNCAARIYSGSNVVLLYFSQFSVYYELKLFIFIFLVVFALGGLKCIWKYSQETHVFRILKDRGNDDELQSYSSPIIDQEVGSEIALSEQQIDPNSNDTELLENELLSKNSILMQHPFKVYLKSVLLILIFRLPLLMVQNSAFSFIVYKCVHFLDIKDFYHHLLVAIFTLIWKVGDEVGTTFRRKSVFLANIFVVTFMLFLISGLMYFFATKTYFIYLVILTQLVTLTVLFLCSDLLLADFLPLKYRPLCVAFIFVLEHLLKLLIYYLTPIIRISIKETWFLFISGIISAISGIVAYFKFDSLYTIYQ